MIMELQIGNLWEVKRWLIGWGTLRMFSNRRNSENHFSRECKGTLYTAKRFQDRMN